MFNNNNSRERDNKKSDRRAPKKVSLKKRFCRFCTDAENVIDFRRPKMLGEFVSERGKISPRRMTGNCQFHQTRLVEAIKRARHLALLPFTVTHAIRD